MADLTPTTELRAVNLILAGIGESPVNGLEEGGNVDAVLAQQQLHTSSLFTQEKGWDWNSLRDFQLPLTFPDNFIRLPANTIKVDTSGVDAPVKAVQRGDRLFNPLKNTFTWDTPLTLDLVQFLSFEELPQAARSYIAYHARRTFQQDRVGSSELAQGHLRDELTAWASLFDAEAANGDRTIFDSLDTQR